MRAAATIVAVPRTGRRTRCTTLRSFPPIALRETPDGLHIVGSAAGPIGGDDVHLDITVADGASLTIRTVAAQVVLPGPRKGPSSSTITATVGRGATLRWLPDPLVLATGCDHRATVTLSLAATASLLWRDEVVLGRSGEASGSVLQRLRVDRAGEPLLRNDLALGPAWPGANGPAGGGEHSVVGTLLVVDQIAEKPLPALASRRAVRAAACEIAPGAVMITILGHSVEAVDDLLGPVINPCPWASPSRCHQLRS